MALLRVAPRLWAVPGLWALHRLWALHKLWAVAVLLLLFGCTGMLSNKVRPDPAPASDVPEGPGVNGPIKDSTASPGTGVSPLPNPNPDPGLTSPGERLPSDESYVPAETDLGFNPGPCSGTAPQILSTAETNADYSKGMINAQVAYDLGLTGHCAYVVVIDTGLSNPPHRELNSERITRDTDTDPATAFHGRSVTSLVAAIAGNGGMHGVAPGANVYHRTVALDSSGYSGPSPASSHPYTPVTIDILRSYSDEKNTNWFRSVLDKGSIFNMSWGQSGSISRPIYTTEALRSALPNWIALMQQADTHPDDRAIFVWAAGNAFNERDRGAVADSPEILAGLPALIPELKGHWLAVAAVREDGLITGFSNRCGIAYDFCLAAPGEALAVPHILELGGDIYVYRSGTSYAAPIVTGALALMMERFRGQLGNTDLVSRLLATANKTGIYADQSIYGQGLLDIGSAVQPVGQSYLSLSGSPASLSSLNSRIIDDSGTLALLSSALGGTEIMVKDELGAPFWHAFQSLPGGRAQRQLPQPQNTLRLDMRYSQGWRHLQVSDPNSRTPGYLVDARPLGGDTALFASAGVQPGWALGAYSAGLRPGDFGNSTAFSAPWMPLLSDGSIGGGATVRTGAGRLTAALFQGGAGQAAAWQGAENSLAAVEYQQRFGNLRLITQAGLLAESDSWRGVQTSGSLYGGFQARTSYVGATGVLPFGGWTLLGALHHSNTDARPSTPGLIQQISGLSDTVLELGALGRSLWQRGDSLGLYLTGQRLDGQVQWQLPVRLQRRQTIYSDLTTDLAGSDRHSLNLHYRLPLDDRTLLSWHLRRGYNLWGSESSRTLSFSHRF